MIKTERRENGEERGWFGLICIGIAFTVILGFYPDLLYFALLCFAWHSLNGHSSLLSLFHEVAFSNSVVVFKD